MSEGTVPPRGWTIDGAFARWALVLSLAFAALHGPALAARFERNTWLYADGAFYFTTVRALAEHGRLEQKDLHPTSWYEQDLGWNRDVDPAWSNVSLGRDGERWYPKHPVLLPFLSVPFFWLFGTPGTLVVNVLLNLAFVLLVFALCRHVARVEIAAFVAALVAAQQIVVSSSYSFSNDVLSAVLLVGAFEAALGGRLRIAGVFMGFATWARVTHLAHVPALALVAWGQAGFAGVWLAARWTALPLGIFALHNWWLFGAPWTVSYQRVLSRVRGETLPLAVANNFTVPFGRGFRHVVTGPEGVFAQFPLFAPGLLGLLALRRTQALVGAAIALFCVPYVLLLVKYDWFRAQFTYPVFGVSALGLAALAERIASPRGDAPAEPLPVSSRAIAAALVVVLVASLGVRLALRRDPSLLSSRVEQAKIFLGATPCDYFNPQIERWECSHFDRGESWMMTGRALGKAPKVAGLERRGIWHHPHVTGEWRRLVFDELPAGPVELTFALTDASHGGEVEVEVLARGAPPDAVTLSRAGQQEQRSATIGAGAGPALEVRVRASDPEWKQLLWDGRIGAD